VDTVTRSSQGNGEADAERQKFVSLADQSTEFIGMCDMDFLPSYVNEAGLRLVGLDSREQALGTPVKEFFFPEDQRFIYEEFFPRALREGRAEVEIRLRHFKTGEPLWMICNVFHIKDAEGKPVGLATVSRDITDRKQAEADQGLLADILQVINRGGHLRPLIAEVLRLVRQASDFDAAGLRLRQGDDYPYFEQTGFDADFIHDENLLRQREDLCMARRDPAGRALLECTCGLVLSGLTDPTMPCFTAGGSFWTNDARGLLSLPAEADPRTNPRNHCIHRGYQSFGLFPVRAGQEIIGLLQLNDRRPGRFTAARIAFYEALAQNIGLAMQRIRAEESLRETARAAEAANAAKGQFLANMSHELRTPMNAILGMIDVALPTASDPVVLDCLATARESADLLLTLLNDLLDSAKIESGTLVLESAPFSLRRMLDQLTRMLAVRASEKGLTFSCHIPDETPEAVLGDRMRLQQILLNLAGNAIKFTEKGKVEVSLRVKDEGPRQNVPLAVTGPLPSPLPSCRARQAGEGTAFSPPPPTPQPPTLNSQPSTLLEFAVRDTGIGISPAEQEKLFRPFSQVDPSMSRRFGGTGLGLSICKSLVERMGGRIWLESEAKLGSTFYFSVKLPLAKELPGRREPSFAARSKARTALRVLLVEDSPANQKVVKYVLRGRGHEVEIAEEGQEALCLCERNHYDVILMDVQMPGMNGLEATAAIRKREGGGRRVPIIAMTAHAMQGDRERCLAAGMDGYLSKPVNAQQLISLVEGLAGGEVPATDEEPD